MLQSVIYRKSRKISNTGQEQYNNILRLRRQPSNDVCEVSSEPPGVGYRYRSPIWEAHHTYDRWVGQQHRGITALALCSCAVSKYVYNCPQTTAQLNNCTVSQLTSSSGRQSLSSTLAPAHPFHWKKKVSNRKMANPACTII